MAAKHLDQIPPEQRDTLTADERWFVDRFIGFVEADCTGHLFTKPFYRVLCNRFGLIAENDWEGFWERWCSTTERRVALLEHILTNPLAYCQQLPDEQVIKDWLWSTNHLSHWQQRLAEETAARERARLAQLQRKYPGGTP